MKQNAKWLKKIIFAWNYLGMCLLTFIILELLATACFYVRDRYREPEAIDPHIHADGYRDVSWASDYYLEMWTAEVFRWNSYTYWRHKPFAGEYINIDEQGHRKTWRDPALASSATAPLRVFMLGGSTTWGDGVRDDYTVPSAVAKVLADSLPGRVEVTNYGENAYVSTQEAILLLRALQEGAKPDVVVFLDGVNDVFSTFQNGQAGLPHNEFNRVENFQLLQNINWGNMLILNLKQTSLHRALNFFINKLHPPGESEIVTRLHDEQYLRQRVAETVSAYQTNVRAVHGLAQSFGFKALFYWQPVIFAKDVRSDYEEMIHTQHAEMQVIYRECYAAVAECDDLQSADGFRDLGALFKNDPAPRFIDFCHLDETGNAVVGAEIAQDVAGIIRTAE